MSPKSIDQIRKNKKLFFGLVALFVIYIGTDILVRRSLSNIFKYRTFEKAVKVICGLGALFIMARLYKENKNA